MRVDSAGSKMLSVMSLLARRQPDRTAVGVSVGSSMVQIRKISLWLEATSRSAPVEWRCALLRFEEIGEILCDLRCGYRSICYAL